MTIDVDTIERDAKQLEESYQAAIAGLDRTWRQIAMETRAQRRASLEAKANDLVYTARVTAGAHARAVKALERMTQDVDPGS